ncbi:MAG: general secretion pathway protein GspF [Bacteroidetes bacterium GWA2_30_7]|nr:MAG: general secretion pathway protein GspF [Bacteroidetes bacterium GWA2_30_7]
MSIDLKNIEKKKKTVKTPSSKQQSQVMDFLNRDISLFGNSLSDKKKERFYSDLGILLTSGIDIKTSLELITDDQRKDKDKQLFNNIQQMVLNGESLSEALHKTGKFSNYEYFSLKIGEESGRISDVLSELSGFFNKKIKQKRQLVSAFSYPVLVLITAVAAIMFMMNFIVPMFVDVFKRFQGKLPYITQVIINISDIISNWAGLFFITLTVFIIFLYSQRKNEWYRSITSRIMMRLPIFGPIVKKIYLARFCQSMALLIASRTPMLRAIQLVRNMIGFYPFEKALDIIDSDIMSGKSLHESMKKFSIFDNRTISLVKVAEEVNQLDTIFERLNKQYSDELEHRIGMMSSLLEPAMIIFVGVLVGVILVAMYLPLFQLSTSIY